MRFDDKVILVTGGANGQGEAGVRLLVEQGARVLIGDVDVERGERLAAELGPGARFLRHDVGSETQWQAFIAAATAWGRGIHGLVNNAGLYIPRALEETDVALFQRHVEVNQWGCFLGMKLVAGAMAQSGGGSIVNISSVAGLRGSAGSFAYCASKWAIRGMTKAAALGLAAQRIRVNSVHPGPIETDMIRIRTPEQNAQRRALVPLKRFGSSLEVARTVVFLLSDDSAFITGAEIAVDGGVSL